MKNKYFIFISIVLLSLVSRFISAQTSCNCWVPRDNSFQIGKFNASGLSGGPGIGPEYRNDDWSTDTITLPFNICFYGTSVNKIFLNNNGNISIGAPYSTFTALSFPDPNYVMIAPFWADVDTRGLLSGLVYYSVTSTHLIVQWENVGYFGVHDDKLNTFQLIVTNGSDPIIPIGQNVSFCYKDMQWTTGDASQGVNGFGGVPATVGVNRGNGFDYVQFGLFDQPGNSYDGPYGANDGVDWLDNQSFSFNACIQNANIPPVLNSLNVCDTIRLCQNTTSRLTVNYLSPEQGETTRINFSPGGMSGVNVISNTPGNTATLILEIVGQTSNLGYHTISITATDNGTPSASTINNFVIQILPAALPGFTFSPSSPIMVNNVVTFTNTSSPGSVFLWDFGDGSLTTATKNPQHVYTSGGNFTVTLSATFPNGCITTVTQQVIVNVCLPATFTVSNACVNAPVTVTYTGVPSASAQYIWNFRSGNVISGTGMGPYFLTWNASGTDSILLTVNDNTCSSTISLPVTVFAYPASSITTLPQLCAGDSPDISFNGSAGSTATYLWDFGIANILSGSGSGPYKLQWNVPGNDQVSLIVSENGCNDTSQINVQINPVPSADFFAPLNACTNDLVKIEYTGSTSSSANYTWNFNGGTVISGSGQGPYTVKWSNKGNYLLGLKVSENGCTSSTVIMPLKVTAIPVVYISTIPSLCIGQINNLSFTGNTGAGSVYNWNFGNASVISGAGAGPYTLQWNIAGSDHVQLSVNDNGCVSQSQIDVTVYPVPQSDFIIDNVACIGAPVTVNYNGTASTAANYHWTFNGGTIVNGSGSGPYSVSWNSPGVITVSLTVDENGCVSPQTDLQTMVNPLPTAFAGNDQIVCSGKVVIIGSASVAGQIYSWTPTINLSDPVISNPTATVFNNTTTSKLNSFIVSVTDIIGCLNSDTVNVTSYPEPVINFKRPSSQCLSENNFLLDALSNLPAGMNYSWIFSPEANTLSSNQKDVSVIYSAVGTFPVTLNGDYNGCPALSYTDSITVDAMPTTDFIPLVTNGCEPLTVPFKNTSTGNGNTYLWNFGDGNNGYDNDAVHVFLHSGEYSVSLSAININGCRADTTYFKLISVYNKPDGKFIPNPEVADILSPVVQFQNYSSNAISYLWDFGDNETSTFWNPSHTYSNTGDYNITLLLVSPHGCLDTVRGVVRVEDSFSFYIPNSFTPNGDGINDEFRGYGVSFKSYLMNIYNRWGELIYSTNDYNKPWDGKMNSETVQNDVFVYRIVLIGPHDEKHTYVGNVSVIK